MKRETWASQMTVISSFVCWPCTMPVSRHSCEDPFLYPVQGTADLCIFIKHITDVIYRNVLSQPFRLLDMPFVVTTIHCSVCQFRKRYLRCKYLVGIHTINMLLHSISFVKELNPCTCVKNVFIHQSSRLISRINSFLRPSLMAASILAASSGSSFQHPAKDISPRLRSSFDNLNFLHPLQIQPRTLSRTL